MNRPSDLTSKIGAEICKRRKILGLSQEELAFSSGVHRTYVSLLERGCKSPTIITLERISIALDVPLFQLIKAAEQTVTEI